MEEIKAGEVYFKLAKYIFRVKLTPNTESTKNSIKSAKVSFGLTFLSRKYAKGNMTKPATT
jgi:hypothetical protein